VFIRAKNSPLIAIGCFFYFQKRNTAPHFGILCAGVKSKQRKPSKKSAAQKIRSAENNVQNRAKKKSAESHPPLAKYAQNIL
jgi:hypothetical protein